MLLTVNNIFLHIFSNKYGHCVQIQILKTLKIYTYLAKSMLPPVASIRLADHGRLTALFFSVLSFHPLSQ